MAHFDCAARDVTESVPSVGANRTLADRALRAVLDCLPHSYTEGANVVVLDSWTEGDDIICLMYRFPWFKGVLGLRRRVEVDAEIQESLEEWAGEVANFEVGEPLGTIAHRLWLDHESVHWWGEVPVPGKTGHFVDVVPRESDSPLPPGFTRWLGPPQD
jgi:hypothetical protein